MKKRFFSGLSNLDFSGHSHDGFLDRKVALNFYYAEKILRLYTYIWLIYQVYTYLGIVGRPDELYVPLNYFSKIFLPSLPNYYLYFGMAAGLVVFNSLALLRQENIYYKLIVAFLVAWFNLVKWNYGTVSHVGHIFVLSHLLSVFLSAKHPDRIDNNILKGYALSIRWFCFGILITYSMSGFWKVSGLVYKILFHPEAVHWLHPKAAFINSVVGHKDSDIPFGNIFYLYEFPLLWQVLFLGAMFFQVFSFYAAVRPQLLAWIGAFNILFHIHNSVFIQIDFYVTPIVLLILFFPYHRLFSLPELCQGIQTNFTKEGSVFTKIIEGEVPVQYYGFDAYREKFIYERRFYAGLLYFPGMGFLGRMVYSLLKFKSNKVIAEA